MKKRRHRHWRGPSSYADKSEYRHAKYFDTDETDPRLDDERDPTLHAPDHIRLGNDPVDGDLIDIDYSPTDYTPIIASGVGATHIEDLASHLKGIDQELGTIADAWRFVGLGKLVVVTNVDGAWIAPDDGLIVRATFYRRTAGLNGSTIIDLTLNDTSIWNVTPGNRPTIANTDGNDFVVAQTVFDTAAFLQNDRLEMDIVAIEGGNVRDAIVVVKVVYS